MYWEGMIAGGIVAVRGEWEIGKVSLIDSLYRYDFKAGEGEERGEKQREHCASVDR